MIMIWPLLSILIATILRTTRLVVTGIGKITVSDGTSNPEGKEPKCGSCRGKGFVVKLKEKEER
jgi:hypothetical protein